MQPPTILSILALALGANSATAAVKRNGQLPSLGAFGVSFAAECPLVDPYNLEFAHGDESDECRALPSETSWRAIDRTAWADVCLLIVFETADCSDPGIIAGPGCWTPPGGIEAYKVTCPYKDSA